MTEGRESAVTDSPRDFPEECCGGVFEVVIIHSGVCFSLGWEDAMRLCIAHRYVANCVNNFAFTISLRNRVFLHRVQFIQAEV